MGTLGGGVGSRGGGEGSLGGGAGSLDGAVVSSTCNIKISNQVGSGVDIGAGEDDKSMGR